MAWRSGHVGDQEGFVVALCRNNSINENVRHAIVPPSRYLSRFDLVVLISKVGKECRYSRVRRKTRGGLDWMCRHLRLRDLASSL